MFKKVSLPLLSVLFLLSLLLTGCGCRHQWKDATCEAPKTCTSCGETEGYDLGHKWREATTETPKTCERCLKTEGERIITDSRFKTEKCKALFGTWSGTVNIPSTYFGLPKLSDDLNFRIILTFHNDGNFEATVSLTNKATVVGHLRAYYVNALYAEFAKQGLDEAQADAAMVATYGMDVKAYSKKLAEETDFSKLTSSLVEDGVYYVSNSWNGDFSIGSNDELRFSRDWKSSTKSCTFYSFNDTQLRFFLFPFTVPAYPYLYSTLITFTKS